MKAFLTVLAVPFVPCAIGGVIEWIITSFLIGWLALAIVIVVFACVLFAQRVRDDEPGNYYECQRKNGE